MRAAAMILCLAAMPVGAQTFSLPAGCEAYVTLQQRSCLVTHNFRCAGDPEGHQQRVDITDQGPIFVSRTDAEGRWIESYGVLNGRRSRLGEETDPASLTELVTEGRDDFDFFTTDTSGQRTRYVGHDGVTGAPVTIDGVTLLPTEFVMRVEDASGTLLWETVGEEFVHPEWRTFVSGRREVRSADGSVSRLDNTPVEFVFPGEPGFLTSEPKYGCGDLLSGSIEQGDGA